MMMPTRAPKGFKTEFDKRAGAIETGKGEVVSTDRHGVNEAARSLIVVQATHVNLGYHDNAAVMNQPDLLLAHECIRRATADVETWLGRVEQGQLARVSPFGQMFIYQLKNRGKLGDRKFAINEFIQVLLSESRGQERASRSRG
jgi:hypothetical protein